MQAPEGWWGLCQQREWGQPGMLMTTESGGEVEFTVNNSSCQPGVVFILRTMASHLHSHFSIFSWLQRNIHYYSFFFNPHLRTYFHCFREKRRGRGREKHQLVTCCTYPAWGLYNAPQPGIKPATKASALMGNQTPDLLVMGSCSNQASHTSQGFIPCLKVNPNFFQYFMIHFYLK